MADINRTVMTPCRLEQAEWQRRAACCLQALGQIKPEHYIQPHNTCLYPRHCWRGASWALMMTWARLSVATYTASHDSLDIKIIQKKKS